MNPVKLSCCMCRSVGTLMYCVNKIEALCSLSVLVALGAHAGCPLERSEISAFRARDDRRFLLCRDD
jgi:hypothetical protein